MKYVVLAGALAFALSTGICEAAGDKPKVAPGSTAVSQESGEKIGSKHIDLGEEPVTSVGVMDKGQNYSANTGFPRVVKSDSDMEL